MDNDTPGGDRGQHQRPSGNRSGRTSRVQQNNQGQPRSNLGGMNFGDSRQTKSNSVFAQNKQNSNTDQEFKPLVRNPQSAIFERTHSPSYAINRSQGGSNNDLEDNFRQQQRNFKNDPMENRPSFSQTRPRIQTIQSKYDRGSIQQHVNDGSFIQMRASMNRKSGPKRFDDDDFDPIGDESKIDIQSQLYADLSQTNMTQQNDSYAYNNHHLIANKNSSQRVQKGRLGNTEWKITPSDDNFAKVSYRGQDKHLNRVEEDDSDFQYDDQVKKRNPALKKQKTLVEAIIANDAHVHDFKDSLETIHIIAYSAGHFANDLIIQIWNTYSALYLTSVILLSEADSGLIVLVGQIIDAIFQPLVSFGSDNIDTRIGKRMPWYIIGNVFLFPMSYMLFNPPEFAIGPNDGIPNPQLWYFLLIPSILNIGQGSFQLSHMAIVNSLSYDQHRRDILLNYRNASQYTAGLLVPSLSYFMFVYIDDDLDQFAILTNICLVLGGITSALFLYAINEPDLIAKSKEVWNRHQLGEDALDVDNENDFQTDETSDKDDMPPHFPIDQTDIDLVGMFDRDEKSRGYNRPSTPLIERSSMNQVKVQKFPFKQNAYGQDDPSKSFQLADKSNHRYDGDYDSVNDSNDDRKRGRGLKQLTKNRSTTPQKVSKSKHSQMAQTAFVGDNQHDALSDITIPQRFKKKDSKKNGARQHQSIDSIRVRDDDVTLQPDAGENEGGADGLMFWFKRADFYVTGMNFVFTRIAQMAVCTGIPFYLKISCGFWPINDDDTPYQNAVTPAMSFLGSLIFSVAIQDHIIYYHTNDKYNMFLYSLFFFGLSGLMIFFIPGEVNTCEELGDTRMVNGVEFVCNDIKELFEEKPYFPVGSTAWILYIGIFIQGFGLGNMLNTSSSLISEMIGTDDESSAVVYATFNILESLSVGGVAAIVLGSGMCDEDKQLKFLMAIVPILCAVCAYIISYWKFKQKHDAMAGIPDQEQQDHMNESSYWSRTSEQVVPVINKKQTGVKGKDSLPKKKKKKSH